MSIIDDIRDESENIELSDDMLIDFIIADDVLHTLTVYYSDGRVEKDVVAKEYDHLWEEIKSSLEPLILKANDLS